MRGGDQNVGCGACGVLIDGQPRPSCVTEVSEVEGQEIVTIERLARRGRLHPVQQAFLDVGAMQCGFCTPGMIVAAADTLSLRRRGRPRWVNAVEARAPRQRLLPGCVYWALGLSALVPTLIGILDQLVATLHDFIGVLLPDVLPEHALGLRLALLCILGMLPLKIADVLPHFVHVVHGPFLSFGIVWKFVRPDTWSRDTGK